MKIEVWGTYPPPIGGVTIHIYRFIHNLHKLEGSIILRNFGKIDPKINYVKTIGFAGGEFLKLLWVTKRVIHLHSNNVFAFLLLLLFGYRHQIGVTIHNKNLVAEKSILRRFIIRRFFFKTAFIILNDSNYKDQLIACFRCKKERVHVLPAFLPPIDLEYQGLDDEILKYRQKHSFLLSANAYKLRMDQGVDVYGFDLLIKLVAFLKGEGIDVGLIFCLPIIGDVEYYEECVEKIKKEGIQDNILIIQRELPNGFEVWKLSDMFLRPTSTDIEGISVKEALFCGTPAVASDVCIRPKEAVLFKSRDFDDLKQKVLDLYVDLEGRIADSVVFEEDTVGKILDIYKSVM